MSTIPPPRTIHLRAQPLLALLLLTMPAACDDDPCGDEGYCGGECGRKCECSDLDPLLRLYTCYEGSDAREREALRDALTGEHGSCGAAATTVNAQLLAGERYREAEGDFAPEHFCGLTLPGLELVVPTPEVIEGGPLHVEIRLEAPLEEALPLDLAATASDEATASAADFGGALPAASVQLEPGETRRSLVFETANDDVVEPVESVELRLVLRAAARVRVLTDRVTVRLIDRN